MEFGPTGYAYEIDSYDASANTIGALTSLPRIVEFGGVNEEGIVTDLTAFSDVFMNEGFIGRSKFDRISLKYYAQLNAAGTIDAASASAVIGRPTRRSDYPRRTFKVTHKTGITQSIEVSGVAVNKPISSNTDDVMFEAVLPIGARVAADYVEAGF